MFERCERWIYVWHVWIKKKRQNWCVQITCLKYTCLPGRHCAHRCKKKKKKKQISEAMLSSGENAQNLDPGPSIRTCCRKKTRFQGLGPCLTDVNCPWNLQIVQDGKSAQNRWFCIRLPNGKSGVLTDLDRSAFKKLISTWHANHCTYFTCHGKWTARGGIASPGRVFLYSSS